MRAAGNGSRTRRPPEYSAQAARSQPDTRLLHRIAFEQLPIGIAYSCREGRFLWANEAFIRMLNLTPGEIVGQSIQNLTHAEDFGQNDRNIRSLWSGEIDSYTQEKRYIRRDRTVIWVRVTATLLRDEADNSICAVGFLEDITARKQAELDLQKSRCLLESVVTNVPAALIACDTRGAITLCNQAAAELFSVVSEPSQFTLPDAAYPITARVFGADGTTPVNRDDQPLARALRGETLTNVEQVVLAADSQPRVTLASTRRMQGSDGKFLGAVLISQDITRLREREAEIERIHKQLMDASRQAGMAEIATNVLHNVGNVLNSVNVSAVLVADILGRAKVAGLCRIAALIEKHGDDLATFFRTDPRGREIPRYLENLAQVLLSERDAALTELRSLASNIDHIKETVAMQQNYAKRNGVPETVDLHTLVEDSLRMNAGALTRHHVSVRREFACVPAIAVDKHKVLQILVNLVRNAKYACDESGRSDKELCVRIDLHPKGVRIAVIDNGIGIDPEHHSRLFSHGFTTRQSGHGFGLHSASMTAAELGGELTAASGGRGCGAEFNLLLPLQPPGMPT